MFHPGHRAVGLVLAVSLLANACSLLPGSDESRGPTPLVVYGVPRGQSAIELTVDSCHGEPELGRLESTDDEVRIEVVSTTYSGEGAPECLDNLTVELGQPLGDRTVIDLSTGEEVPDLHG